MRSRFRKRTVILCFLLSFSGIFVYGQTGASNQSNGSSSDSSTSSGSKQATGSGTSESGVDEGALFGEVQPVEKIKPKKESAPQDDFLLSKGIEWGGTLTSTMTAYWDWTGGSTFPSVFSSSPTSRLVTDLEASLYFDSRPATSFRVFGKLKASYPFATTLTLPSGFGVASGTTLSLPNVEIFELFSDFNIDNKIFFRAGKQTVKWGVGYFFSPADVLSLTPINPEKPEEEREGPLAVKATVPLGLNTLTLYIINNDVQKPEDLAFAGKFDLVVGGWELSAGGFYQRDLVPKAVLMATGSIWRFNLFGEAIASYGSDRVFLQPASVSLSSPYGFTTETVKNRLFASGTIGFTLTFPDQNFTLTAQYYYNGEGYDSSALLVPALTALAASNAGGPAVSYTSKDLAYFGKQYVAASATLTKLGTEDVQASLFFWGNMSDLSGLVQPQFTYQINDYFGVYVGIALTYGKSGDELAPTGTVFSPFFGATLGAGAF